VRGRAHASLAVRWGSLLLSAERCSGPSMARACAAADYRACVACSSGTVARQLHEEVGVLLCKSSAARVTQRGPCAAVTRTPRAGGDGKGAALSAIAALSKRLNEGGGAPGARRERSESPAKCVAPPCHACERAVPGRRRVCALAVSAGCAAYDRGLRLQGQAAARGVADHSVPRRSPAHAAAPPRAANAAAPPAYAHAAAPPPHAHAAAPPPHAHAAAPPPHAHAAAPPPHAHAAAPPPHAHAAAAAPHADSAAPPPHAHAAAPPPLPQPR